MTEPRIFALHRDRDISGVSGTGIVADGCAWPDGTVSIRWRGASPSTVSWNSVADAEHVHGHGGATRIVWVTPAGAPIPPGGNAEDCPRCTGTNPPYPFLCPGHPAEAQQDTVRTAPDTTRTPDGRAPGQSRTPETPQDTDPGQQDTAPDIGLGPSSYPYLDTLGVLLSRMARGVLLEAERPLLREHVEHLLADRSRSEHAASRLMEQRQEMPAERYAWQERGRKAEAALTRLDQMATAWLQQLPDTIRTATAAEAVQHAVRAVLGDPAADTCRPVEVDGETIRVHSRGQSTEREQEYLAEIVRAAKRKDAAEHPAAGQVDDSSPAPAAVVHPDAEQQASSAGRVDEMPITAQELAHLLADADAEIIMGTRPARVSNAELGTERTYTTAQYLLQRCHITTKSAPAAGPCDRHPGASVIGGMCGGCTAYPADMRR
ncbi:hypothetical protein [Streptomyces decoyicus]